VSRETPAAELANDSTLTELTHWGSCYSEHYFEMPKTDAQEALSIYKAFVKQNDKVVDFLNTAKRLKSVLDVPVPNLRHVSRVRRGGLRGDDLWRC